MILLLILFFVYSITISKIMSILIVIWCGYNIFLIFKAGYFGIFLLLPILIGIAGVLGLINKEKILQWLNKNFILGYVIRFVIMLLIVFIYSFAIPNKTNRQLDGTTNEPKTNIFERMEKIDSKNN